MAIVYKVIHEQLGSAHALKVLRIPSASVRDRLMEEGRVQARIRHPNLVSVTDVLVLDQSPALVMEFVDGPPLDKWLETYRPSLSEALALFKGIVRGVGAAHREGRVHRDLKPGNVLLDKTDGGLIPKITDFGLVKVLSEKGDGDAITQTGMGMGTPQYMAPEQIRDASKVDQRADMFALGCLLYELVCGRRAFDGADTLSIFNKVANAEYRPPEDIVPDLPPVVGAAIRRLLVTNPERRVDNCDVLLEMLYGRAHRETAGDFVVPVQPAGRLDKQQIIDEYADLNISSDAPTPIIAMRTVTPAQRNQRTQSRPVSGDQATQPPPPPVSGPHSAPSAPSFHEERRRSSAMAAAGGAAAAVVVMLGLFGVYLALNSESTEPVDPGHQLSDVTGDAGFITALGAKRVELVGRGKVYRKGDKVPPGKYRVVADFPDSPAVEAGTVNVRSGEAIRLKCDAESKRCIRND